MNKGGQKRGGRAPDRPHKLAGGSGGWVGEHARFTIDQVKSFADKHSLSQQADQLYRKFQTISDQLASYNVIRESEPTRQQWRQEFNNLSRMLGKALTLMGLNEDDVRSGRRTKFTPVLERAAIAAHRDLFEFREGRIENRSLAKWALSSELNQMGVNAGNVGHIIRNAPDIIRIVQIAAELGSIDPIVMATTKHRAFAHLIISLYEEATERNADLSERFGAFLADCAKLLDHRIESEDAMKAMIRNALRERANGR